jgi:hypothetical protein
VCSKARTIAILVFHLTLIISIPSPELDAHSVSPLKLCRAFGFLSAFLLQYWTDGALFYDDAISISVLNSANYLLEVLGYSRCRFFLRMGSRIEFGMAWKD